LKTLGGVALLVNCERSLQNSLKWPNYMLVSKYFAKQYARFVNGDKISQTKQSELKSIENSGRSSDSCRKSPKLVKMP